ncbi:MAG: nucleoside-diphosphate sugar epimerase/dehydratase [Opitutaceae bacterium]|jgi:FlaA1/EpsC-like NDP-sugar epimerase
MAELPNILKTGRRFFVLLAIYSCVIGICYYLAFEVRFDFVVPPLFQNERFLLLLPVIAVKLLALYFTGQFGSLVTYFSLPDLFRLAWAMLGSSLLFLIARTLGHADLTIPRGVLLIDFLLCSAGLCSLRLATRLYRERIQMSRKMHHAGNMERIAIVGAGDAGASLAKDLLNAPSRGMKPVAFLDDDGEKHGQQMHGVPVVGTPEEFPEMRCAEGVHRIVIAIPSASSRRIREIALFLAKKGYKVETLPSIEELASGRAKATRIRPVEVQDLLGREQVKLDTQAIKGFVEGKIVMVTGAGGSIGSELCRQIARLNPKRLLMLEQSEGSLFLIEQEMKEEGMGAIVVPLVADILDVQRIDYLFTRFQPQVIFHAAAHKHVYMMERQPMEAIRNNATGTRLLADAAAKHGVEAFVFISTDKAINPTSVMGASKRLAEIHLEALSARCAAAHGAGEASSVTTDVASVTSFARLSGAGGTSAPTKFMAVRFGNVLGSSGSVVPIFKKQIEAGGPVTVTHPDVMRFFMTIPEAVGLVMQASVLGNGGEIFVLDMGHPVKIVELAKQMIELSGLRLGEDITIEFTGLKPGEKLYEELQHRDEQYHPTKHPRIMRFTPKNGFEAASERAVRELEARLYKIDANEAKAILKGIIPEYTPHWE